MEECKPLVYERRETCWMADPGVGGLAYSGKIMSPTPFTPVGSPYNRPISVYRLREMPIQSCGQSFSAPRGKAGARLNTHTELQAKRQR